MRASVRLHIRLAAALAVLLGGALYAGKHAPAYRAAAALSTVMVSDDGGHGSGVHIGAGYIVTAAHVVEDNKEMQITDSAGGEQTAVVLWSNADYDIALIRVANPRKLGASSLSCDKQQIGADLQGIGNPIDLKFIHTWGRVASTPAERGPWKVSVIADLTIAPGMSGGPVFNDNGAVVGIMVGNSINPHEDTYDTYALSYIVPSTAICMLMGRTS